jgi:hypothetical protein
MQVQRPGSKLTRVVARAWGVSTAMRLAGMAALNTVGRLLADAPPDFEIKVSFHVQTWRADTCMKWCISPYVITLYLRCPCQLQPICMGGCLVSFCMPEHVRWYARAGSNLYGAGGEWLVI